MFDCHQDEPTFWRTMNPARLQALFTSYFSLRHRAAEAKSESKPQAEMGLAAYLMGGG